MARVTQGDRVLSYMRTFGSITSLEAFRDLGVTRLAAVIFELKKTHNIVAIDEKSRTRYGTVAHYYRYSLEKEE